MVVRGRGVVCVKDGLFAQVGEHVIHEAAGGALLAPVVAGVDHVQDLQPVAHLSADPAVDLGREAGLVLQERRAAPDDGFDKVLVCLPLRPAHVLTGAHGAHLELPRGEHQADVLGLVWADGWAHAQLGTTMSEGPSRLLISSVSSADMPSSKRLSSSPWITPWMAPERTTPSVSPLTLTS